MSHVAVIRRSKAYQQTVAMGQSLQKRDVCVRPLITYSDQIADAPTRRIKSAPANPETTCEPQ